MDAVLFVVCLSDHLAGYFLADSHKKDLNKTNVLGTGGLLAEELAKLIKVV